MTADRLQTSAFHYLARYSTSSEGLRRVLLRRLERERRRLLSEGTEPPATDPALVEAVVERCVRAGLLDDARFAAGRVATLRHRGYAAGRIRQALQAKGVAREVADAAIESDGSDDDASARRFAERRRLGPFRMRPDPGRRDRDIAAMMRAGFPYGLARAVIDGEPVAEA